MFHYFNHCQRIFSTQPNPLRKHISLSQAHEQVWRPLIVWVQRKHYHCFHLQRTWTVERPLCLELSLVSDSKIDSRHSDWKASIVLRLYPFWQHFDQLRSQWQLQHPLHLPELASLSLAYSADNQKRLLQ